MGKICELDFHVANLIAAGEVVERPASVIKELLENAIDSGADNISVEIKNGGISFMRVTDNGCGMEPDDVPVSIRRHATSKIRNAQDLNSISTLGFRGEALAAIASVSTLRILTKTKNAQVGTSLESENGKITSVFETGAPVGTTVIVENLFANVPARYKFLKRNITEAMAVSSVVEKIALSHPEISINYIIDGERKISTPGDGILKNAVWAVLGADFAKNTLPLRNSSEGVGISGIIGSQTNYRSNRNMQIFFINHRIIVNRTASAALEQAFSSYIPSDKFPCCVINIELNPALVDVNVHPSKTEVKFSDDKKLFDAIYYGVRSVLEKNSQRPTLTVTVPTPPKAVSSFVPISDKYSKEDAPKQIPIDLGIVGAAPKKDETALDLASLQNLADAMKVSAGDDIRPQPPKFSISYDDGEKYDVPKYEAKHVQSEIAEKKPDLQYVIVGELFNTYVICEFENKVVFVDKHAAHERIIFERLKNRIPIGDSYVKCLMLPITVNLSFDDVSALSEYGDFIRDAGFAFDISSNGDAANITEIPAYIDAKKANDVFITMLSDLSNGKKSISVSRNLIFERALYTVACKAAIKAGRIYQTEELRAICDELFANDAIRVCPHGRPVAYEMTKKDFDRQFGR